MLLSKFFDGLKGDKYAIPALLFVVALLMRLPSLFHELPPFQFCDEFIFSNETRDMLSSGRLIANEFKAGGFNIYPALIISKLISVFSIHPLDFNTLIVIGRAFYILFLSSGTVIFIYLTGELISKNKYIGVYSALAYLISPFIIANSRIWYPDNYIAFFSAGFLYFLLSAIKNKEHIYKNLTLIALFFATSISIKYTAIFLSIPLSILFINIYFKKINILRLIFFTSVLIILFTFILNFSILFNFDKFVEDWYFNINNYNRLNYFNWGGLGYYYFVLYILTFGFLGSLLYIYGYFLVYKNSAIIFSVLFIFPILLASYLGSAGLVLSRNMTIAIPFLMPIIGYAFYYCFHGNNGLSRVLKFSIIFLGSLVLIGQFSQTIISLSNDFKPDSTIVARQWISENIPPRSTIGVGDTCSGESPAKINGNALVIDSRMEKGLDYYVFNSYWNSRFDSAYRDKAFWQTINQKYIHFYFFNNQDIFKCKSVSPSLESLIPRGYTLDAFFDLSGPEILVLKKRSISINSFILGKRFLPGYPTCFEVLFNGEVIPGLYLTKILGVNGQDLEGVACHGAQIIADPITGVWHEKVLSKK